MDLEKDSEHYRLQLEHTEKQLNTLTNQLDSVLNCNSKLGVGMEYVIATVNELQSLMEWTSETKANVESGAIFQKLQQLERIQKELEETASESEQIRTNSRVDKTMSSLLFPSKDKLIIDVTAAGDNNVDCSNTDNEPVKSEFFKGNNANNSEFDEKENTNIVNTTETYLLIDLTTDEEEINRRLLESRCTCSNSVITNEVKRNDFDVLDSLGPNISEDEGLGEESRRSDSTGPSSFIDIHDTVSDILTLGSLQSTHENIPPLIVTEDGKNNKNWLSDSKDSLNSLELCMCAIGNLKESLRVKENELLKLSGIQNDQKQISALQDVIINLHNDTAKLQSQLESTKKENSVLKEQVLELEEAENDARLQAQRLGEKLVFLQEKDSHFQAELSETKKSLEKCIDELSVKEVAEVDLRSQLKYVEALVQKYEDQIHVMEVVELALRKKLLEQEDEVKLIENSIKESTREKCERGTQTYPPPLKNIKLFESSRSEEEEVSDDKPIISSVTSKQNNEYLSTTQQKVDCSVQTDSDVCSSLVKQQLEGEKNTSDVFIEDSISQESSTTERPIQKELLKRLHQLVEEDAHLQQQLHYVDQINLTLWKKLHNLEFNIGECKKRNISEDNGSDSCFDMECGDSPTPCSRPPSMNQFREDSIGNTKCVSPSSSSSRGIIACLDQSEQEIKDRLLRLEKINASFERELELREQLYLEKDRKYEEWVQVEQRFIGDMKSLEDERSLLTVQVTNLRKEKEDLSDRVNVLQAELIAANERHRLETTHLKIEQEEMNIQLQKKIELLLTKEKTQLKQITNLKLENSNDKTESEKLKVSYVELQFQLSRTRKEMKVMEEEYQTRLDQIRNKHAIEEARLLSELDVLRNKNTNCAEMIVNYQARQSELFDILKQKENELEEARLQNKKSMNATEEEHRAIEAQLKSKLRQMEEGTAITTRALTEERIRLERELQENILDLRTKEELYKGRIAELETNVSRLHDELHRVTGDLDSGFEPAAGGNGFRREKLAIQLRELRDREAELREKLDEMEQKEAAYRETLEHADRIVASVEQGYKNKIEELEQSEKSLRQRVGDLEEVESGLRGALSKERRSSDGRRPDELVTELAEAEVREHGLKEKIERLEQGQRSAAAKVRDLEKLRERLEAQLSDKDELSWTLKRNQQELETARQTLLKLQKSESDLRTSLHQVEGVLLKTEGQMKTKIGTMEEENKGLEETVAELRNQVRDLKQKLEQNSEESFPITLHGQSVTNTPMESKDMTDIDYAEVDESDNTDELQNVKEIKTPQLYKQNPFAQLLERKSTPLSFSSFSKPHLSYRSKEVAKITPTTRQDILPKKETKQFLVKSTCNISDSYDDARQNFENCMKRAMAAMTMDLEKSKKLSKDHSTNRNQSVPVDNSSNLNQKLIAVPVKEENDYDEILPRPTNFRVVQQVGSDTLLVGWEYVNTSVLEGFEVYVNGHLHETVYTPDRTKALVSGLNLNGPLSLSICALSHCGQMSEPEILQLPSPQERNSGFFFDDEEEDDEELFDDAVFEKQQRPYSMEW